MKNKFRPILCLILSVTLSVTFSACGMSAPSAQDSASASASEEVPAEIDSIVVLAPSLAETVVALGLGEKIVGYDLQSEGIAGLPDGAPTFDTVNPDMESLAALSPDILLVTNLSLYDEEEPYKPLTDAGVRVLCIPTSESISGIQEDIRLLAESLHVPEAGESILEKMDAELDKLASVASGIPEEERKSVYFEISAAPYLYSCGSKTYLSEMIEWVGGKNIFSAETGWLNIEGEAVAAANPDVIFTSVNYVDNPVDEILSRDGWAGVSAIQNRAVYAIDNMSSSLPNQNIITAMRQMAEILYPEAYGAA